MSNATSAAATFLAGLLLAGAAMTAAAQDFKPGLWEIKQKPELDPQRQAQMEQMQKQMAALPPEQRKQLESMMSKNGVSMNFQGGELTLKSCVTREQADRAGIPKTEGKCEHDSKRTGDRMLVWGGTPGNLGVAIGSGASYDPVQDTWSALPDAPAGYANWNHTAVWTGSLMIVWGGSSGNALNSGGRYDPMTDTGACQRL